MTDTPGNRAFVASALIFAAILGYFSLPLLAFANPVWLLNFGFIFALGASCWWFSRQLELPKSWRIFGTTFGLVGLLGLGVVIMDGFENSTKNDERCVIIERDMLSASPRRADGPDIFAAMNCRPQLDDTIAFPTPIVDGGVTDGQKVGQR